MNRDTIHRIFDAEATDKEIKEVQEWVSKNDRNMEIFVKERRLYDCLNISSETLGKTARANHRIRTKMLYAMCAVAAISAAVFFSAKTILVSMRPSNVLVQTISTGAGQSADIVLPDGTLVSLNSMSTISYPTSFGKKNRSVSMRGEAYFDVVKDGKEFIVQTEYGDITVLGTKFNVEAYEGKEFITSLFSGSVKVTHDNNSFIIKPGQMACLQDSVLIIREITNRDHYLWREGLICFSNENLNGITKTLEKTFGYSFVFASDKKYDVRFSGKFFRSDSIANILSALQAAIDFDYDMDNYNKTVIIK